MKIGDTEWATVATVTGARMQELFVLSAQGQIPANGYEPLIVTVLFELSVFMLAWNHVPSGYKTKIQATLKAIERYEN